MLIILIAPLLLKE